MRTHLSPTPIPDLVVVEIDFFQDERGFFLESWNKRDLAAAGLDVDFVQDSHSRSRAGVLRGLHYQDMRAPIGKLVRCTAGSIFDVGIDLRVGSPTFAQWFGLELSADNKRQLYVPVGFAHGFVALTDGAEVQYKQTGYYAPEAEGAVLWNDPQIAINWPISNPVLSRRDQGALSLSQYLDKPAFHWQCKS